MRNTTIIIDEKTTHKTFDIEIPLARNIIANWLWYFLVLLSGFVIPRFIDRYQGQELLGIWDFGWTLVFHTSLLTLGIASAVNRYVARYRINRNWKTLNATISSCLAIISISAIIGVFTAVGFTLCVPYLLPNTEPELIKTAQWVVLLLCITAALQLPGSIFNAIITGYERFDILNLIRGVQDLIIMLGMMTVLIMGYGIIELAYVVFACQLMGNLTKVLASYQLCPTLHISPKRCRLTVIKEMILFGGKTVIQNLSRTALYQVNSILVAVFLGPATLAVYTRQRSLVMHTSKFVKQYAQVFIPKSSTFDANNNKKALQTLLIQSSKYGLYITLPIMAVMFVMGGPLLEVWMGPDYKAPLVLCILAISHLFSISQHSVYSILVGMGIHGRPALYDLVAAVFSIVLGFIILGIWQSNMAGAAIAVAIPVFLSGGVAMPLYACRQLKLPVWQYMTAIIPGPIAATAPIAVSLLISRLTLNHHPFRSLGIGLIFSVFIMLFIYWKWVIPISLKNNITQSIRDLRHRPLFARSKLLVAIDERNH